MEYSLIESLNYFSESFIRITNENWSVDLSNEIYYPLRAGNS